MVFKSGDTPWNKGRSKYNRPNLPISWRRVKQLFNNKRADARTRDIPFRMTFDEWLDVWLKSGHLVEAGCRDGQYVMARYGDKGPYKIGNVKIITANANSSEKTISIKGRKAIAKANTGNSYTLGRHHSEETKQKISKAQIESQRKHPRRHSVKTRAKIARGNTGKIFSEARKRKISLAAQRRWQTETARQEHSNRMRKFYEEERK